MTLTWRDVAQRVGIGALVVAAVVLALGVAWLVPHQPMAALTVAVVVLVSIAALVQPVTLPILAMPLSVVVLRISGGGVDLTLSDAMLALAFWPAVLMSPRPLSRELRALLWLNAVYQALTIFTLIANPFLANTVEWFHAWLLVSGALMVGWAVGASGHARLGITLFLVACLLLAVPTIAQAAVQYAGGNFGAVYPRWPWPMHKNFIGNLLSLAALLVYARPSWMGWSKRWAVPALLVFLAGVAVSQSRQALIGLALALLVVSLRGHAERRRAAVALIAIVPILYVVLTMVRDQIASGNEHNSWFQRLEWYTEALRIWGQSPLFGHGLRYWTLEGAAGRFQPPNAFLEVAASTGAVGLLGFLLLLGGAVVILYRMDPSYGTLALALLLSRFGQSVFDLFWVSIAVSVPFMLIGVCLGAASRDGTARTSTTESVASAGVGR